MKEIKLSNGDVAFIDNEDYSKVIDYRWYLKKNKGKNCRYAIAYSYKGNKQNILRMHRIIMNASIDEEIDHINGNGLDNRKENLRKVSHWQNVMNTKIGKNNTTGFKGVCKIKDKWVSRIQFNKKKIYIGCFNNKIEAAKAYDIKAKEIFGEYANLNFK